MSYPEAIFKIVKNNDCPFYVLGDSFVLSGHSFSSEQNDENEFNINSAVTFPKEKMICRTLVGNLLTILILYETMSNIEECERSCSGCTGTIRFAFEKRKKPISTDGIQQEMDTEKIASLLRNFSIFQSLSGDDLRTFVTFLQLRKFPEEEIIIKKGDPGTNLYIIVSGQVEILDEEGVSLAFLGPEEVFGEMSLLSGEPVGATVKAVKAGILLYLNGKNFRKVLGMFPTLQMYFARLLARRLTQTNIVRAQEIKSGMIGKLSDMPPSELFQTFNINQKTGKLNLSLSGGAAQIYFRDGSLIKVDYQDKDDKEALYEILKEKKGRFQFHAGLPDKEKDTPEIGNFMWLLMEGLRRADETQEEDV